MTVDGNIDDICDIEFVIVIFCTWSTTVPIIKQGIYTKDRYTMVLPHTFYYKFCLANEC